MIRITRRPESPAGFTHANTLEFSRTGEPAYQVFRDAIFSGEFAQGERLNQDELARRLGVSRAPIRDALNRLEAEGLTKTLSQSGGVVVADISEQEMADSYELRAILDSASARLACERMSDTELGRLAGRHVVRGSQS